VSPQRIAWLPGVLALVCITVATLLAWEGRWDQATYLLVLSWMMRQLWMECSE
jgi:hypothetical protein